MHFIEHDLAENPVGETVWLASAIIAERLRLERLLRFYTLFNDRHPE